MTTLNEAKEAITDRFVTLWGSTSPFTFDNEAFTKPPTWVRLVVRHTGSNQETLGRVLNRKYNRQGSIFIQVFTPIDQGTQQADNLAQTARDIFEGVSFNGIYANDAIIREVGPEGDWYQINVEILFFYEGIK